MHNIKVGDRVRYVKYTVADADPTIVDIGSEGVVIEVRDDLRTYDVVVQIDNGEDLVFHHTELELINE